MAEKNVRIYVSFTIHEGKADELSRVVTKIISGCQQESGTLGFDWYISADGKRCRLLETYEGANGLLAHLTGSVMRELVPMVLNFANINCCEVFGDPGQEAAQILAQFGAEVFALWQALERPEQEESS